MTEVSVLGCGWLGLPLAEFLVGEGFAVKGSTTTPDKLPLLEAKGIRPFLLNLQQEPDRQLQEQLRRFLETDILIINIPPRLATQGDHVHAAQIRYLTYGLIFSDVKIIYVSSTSVYPDENQEVAETSKVIVGHGIVEAEQVVRHLEAKPPYPTILRCGGLMGYNRIPGKYVAGKTIDTGDVPVNFVHRDDVVRIIYEIIRQEKWGEIYNVVAPQHPVRREVYAQNIRDFGFAPPVYKDGSVPPHKVVNGDKLIRELNYSFLFPNPVTFHFEP